MQDQPDVRQKEWSMGYEIDTYAYAKRLKETGFTREQSEVLVELFSETARAFPERYQADMISPLELAYLRNEIAQSELRTTVWIGKLVGLASITIVLVFVLV
jgi:hypothetical protein